MKKFAITISVLLAVLIGFSIYGGIKMHKDEQAQEAAAENSEAKNDIASDNFDGTWEVDTESSKVIWTGRKKIVTNWVDRGSIGVKSGEITIASSLNNWSGTVGEIVFDMPSITSIKTGTEDKGGSDRLNDHLKSADFFDVVKYPESRFDLEKVTRNDSGGYDLDGNLTIKGITKPVTLASITELDFVLGGEGKAIEAKGTVKFNRADFDVKFGSDSFFQNLGDKIIEDEVTLDLIIVALKK